MGLHMPELILVLVVAVLIFGPKKLPEMGSAIGKGIKALRKGMNEISSPEEADLSTSMPKDALSGPDKDVNSQTSRPSTGEEIHAEKHAG
ncbi:MAG TPA: twin-arginine translocase TatA/TatE family subunit [Ktedonobacteraceae bacterium]|jgi:sec-independent protein translocase protein TatA